MLHVGCVVSPTLAMTVLWEAEISAFQPGTFYTVNLNLPIGKASSGRIKDKAEAEALAQSCINGTAVVTRYERKEKSEKVQALVEAAATLLGKTIPAEILVKPIINSRKVSDHHAIIHTLELQNCNFTELPKGGICNFAIDYYPPAGIHCSAISLGHSAW